MHHRAAAARQASRPLRELQSKFFLASVVAKSRAIRSCRNTSGRSTPGLEPKERRLHRCRRRVATPPVAPAIRRPCMMREREPAEQESISWFLLRSTHDSGFALRILSRFLNVDDLQGLVLYDVAFPQAGVP